MRRRYVDRFAMRYGISVSHALLLGTLLLCACGTHTYHIVQPGDTLYSIGWAYGYDYKVLARWNELKPPYALARGQRIRLMSSGSAARAASAQPGSSSPKVSPAVPPVVSVAPPLPRKNESAVRDVAPSVAPTTLQWQWPARGVLLSRFDADDPLKKGMNIGGQSGQPVYAAASGKVVYSGSGLIGYGKLIILKHNDTYLSAYAHNKELRVHEGELVDRGRQIAEMGSSGTNVVMLHFEIRRDGVPVDPLFYLPSQQLQ